MAQCEENKLKAKTNIQILQKYLNTCASNLQKLTNQAVVTTQL